MITLPSKIGQIITILETEARNWLSEHLGLEDSSQLYQLYRNIVQRESRN